jgi:hypothetical protein
LLIDRAHKYGLSSQLRVNYRRRDLSMPDRLLVEEADGRVRVSLRRADQVGDEARAAVAFTSPFAPAAREDLRWYLESYLSVPYAVYETRGQAIQERLRGWGETLFDEVFGAGKPGRDLYLQAREGQAELALTSRSPGFLGLPWELLKDPERDTPLALAMTAFDRTISVAGAATPVPPGDELRVLMVIARPSGPRDVGYQMVARPLLQRLDAVRGKVALEVLRPPTLERLIGVLRAAADRPYHILHFDGHGTFGAMPPGVAGGTHFDAGAARGYLLFEREVGGEQQVAADQFALVVSEGKVPLVVLNACRSGCSAKRRRSRQRWRRGCWRAAPPRWWQWATRSMRWRRRSSWPSSTRRCLPGARCQRRWRRGASGCIATRSVRAPRGR